MTNASGALSELDDYYPYGAVAYENTTTDLDNWYKFTGKELDSETNLQYFGARYYDNNLGRFTSVDPILAVLHDNEKIKGYGWNQKALLADPQLLNSYAYSRNNPINLTDPNGEIIPLLVGWAAVYGVPAAIIAVSSIGATIATSQWGQAIGYSIGGNISKSNEMADRTITTVALTGAGVEGIMVAGELVGNRLGTQQNQLVSSQSADQVRPGQQIKSYSQTPNSVREAIPVSWGEGSASRTGGGWRWSDPNSGATVRLQPGNINARYSTQMRPYLKITDSYGRPLDEYGNVIQGYQQPSKAPEAHIPLDRFNPDNYKF